MCKLAQALMPSREARKPSPFIGALSRLHRTVHALVYRPRFLASETGAFNGQAERKRLFQEILQLPFDAIVETGTCMGSTTGYMSLHAKIPVYSCETSHLFHFAAKRRLADLSNIELRRSDSREFLAELAGRKLCGRSVLFYLDAHWEHDLPLREELEIIGRGWQHFVVMIDDFKVDADEGYRHDDYGPGRVLALPLIAQTIEEHGLAMFAPSAPSERETGHKRGCIVLGSSSMAPDLRRLPSLRSWEAQPSSAAAWEEL